MNRHGIVNLLPVVAFLAVLVVTTVVLLGTVYAPTATRDAVTDVGVVLALLVWFGMGFGVVRFRDRIQAGLYHRYEISDQSPSTDDR